MKLLMPQIVILAGMVTSHAVSVVTGAEGNLNVYEDHIKPLLRERCFSCHGALKQQAGLRLDTVELMLRGGDSGPIVVKHDVAKSLLFDRVSDADPATRMPPEHEGEPLTSEQLEWVRNWITDGVPAPVDEQPEPDPRDHWAFRAVVRPDIPRVRNGSWAAHPIDAFLAAKQEELQLVPQPEAPREILLRRLYLDLIGIPPTAEEIAAFVNDESPDWYLKPVDRLLDDPRYGERWGRHWMDVWRYSDWWGLGDQLRNSQKHIWHWRDWIIESLNADLPYDEMIRQMLAADELYPNDLEKLRATGYLARNYFLFNRNQWMEETVEHVSKGFLGLTMNCSKCHDHKFDPFLQADFYRMRAFFEPYHVRNDVLPGEPDLVNDGIPRVFDGVLDAPTYRFIRGQEKSPDTSKLIEPGLPEIFNFTELKIEPIDLPREAWQPARRPWVIETNLASAAENVQQAEKQTADAQEKLVAVQQQAEAALSGAKQDAPKDADATPTFQANFQELEEKMLDEKVWRLFGGKWSVDDSGLNQTQDGQNRASLRWQSAPVRDFDVTMKFTIQGGSLYRSVGLSFDVTQNNPTEEVAADESEQIVYVSAQDSGPKLQGAYQSAGQWNYPSDANIGRSIELNREYTLRVQARDQVVNASLDGEHVLAWKTPLERREGAIQFITFDALVTFHEVTIAPLAADVVLKVPGEPSAEELKQSVAVAEHELRIANLMLEKARAEQTSVSRRAEAMQAAWKKLDAEQGMNSEGLEQSAKEAAASAAQAERDVAVVKERLNVAQVEWKLLQSPADKKESVEKELTSARDALQAAEKRREEPSEQFTPLTGALWFSTRFLSSTADDPTIAFSATSTGRRAALARWITDKQNPLTARVAVNHLWMRHMGTPLVPTVFDFGRKGIPPRHPELVDWLAAEFMEHEWSMKHLHRLIVTSAAYRMSSSLAGGEANIAIDEDNHYLWRRVPIRLESQIVRDSLLSLSGQLDATMGGPPVPSAQQANSKRRSLYFFHSNNERNLFLTTFDEALVKDCYRREQSIVPQQALALSNSQLVLESAPRIANRISETSADDGEFIRRAFLELLAIRADESEIDASRQALDAWRKLPPAEVQAEGIDAGRTYLIWVLLNHNDFVTLR